MNDVMTNAPTKEEDLAGVAAAIPIRRYDLGMDSRIKDLRTGRSTSKVKHFFRGHLEMLAPPPGAASKESLGMVKQITVTPIRKQK